MPNRSLEFAEACSSRGASSSAPPSDALRKRRKRKQLAASSESPNVNDPDVDVWTFEATRITTSIKQLSTFLSSIRRAYLDLSHHQQSGSSSLYKGKQNAENRDLDLSKGILEAWKDVRWLSDRERDEVDYQAKTMIRTCMARVKELETAEKSEPITSGRVYQANHAWRP
jgi:syntaxin 18